MECDTNKQVRVCSQCGYKVKDIEKIRCPRCFKILLKKCSECNKCNFS